MKRASATNITRLRPQESATTEAKGDTRRAKRDVHDVMMDLSSDDRGLPESDVPMDTRVADITPVSSVGCPLALKVVGILKVSQPHTPKQQATDASGES
jgi:hypothetical protein